MNYNNYKKTTKQLFSCNFEAVWQQSGEFFIFYFYDSQQIYLPL